MKTTELAPARRGWNWPLILMILAVVGMWAGGIFLAYLNWSGA